MTVTFTFAHHCFANDYDLYPCLFIYSSLGLNRVSPFHFSQAIPPINQKVELLPLIFYLFEQLSDTSALFQFFLELQNSNWHKTSWVSS
jgi:hypothetical protein